MWVLSDLREERCLPHTFFFLETANFISFLQVSIVEHKLYYSVLVFNPEVTLLEHLPAQSVSFHLHRLRSVAFVWGLTGHNAVPFWLGGPV